MPFESSSSPAAAQEPRCAGETEPLKSQRRAEPAPVQQAGRRRPLARTQRNDRSNSQAKFGSRSYRAHDVLEPPSSITTEYHSDAYVLDRHNHINEIESFWNQAKRSAVTTAFRKPTFPSFSRR